MEVRRGQYVGDRVVVSYLEVARTLLRCMIERVICNGRVIAGEVLIGEVLGVSVVREKSEGVRELGGWRSG